MNITVCGSMAFSSQMLAIEKQLEAIGHQCYLPEGVEEYAHGIIQEKGGSEGAKRKIDHDLIRRHYLEIEKADAILVVNYTKNGIKHYIGGNSFLEMGFAYILEKPIFLLNPIPNCTFTEEMIAMRPTIINNDFSKIE